MAEELDTSSAVAAYLNDPNPPTSDPVGATRVSVAAALGSNPDLEAELRQVASRTGIPIDSVRRHPEEVKREAALTSFNFERLARDFPSTAGYLAGVENARIAHDDVDNMGVIEKGIRGLSNLGSAAASAFPQAGGALWRVGQAGAENLAPLLDPLAGTLLPENPLRRLAAGMAGMGRAGEASAKGLMPQATGNIEAGVYSGVQSLVTMGLTLPASIVTGNPAPTLYGMSGITGGQAYGQAREAGLDPYRALMFGTSQAAIEYATERIPVGRFLHDMKAGTPFWNMLLRQVSAEIPGEQVATVLQDLNEWAVINPAKPFSEYLAERPSAAAQTLVATIVASGGAVGTAQLANTAADRLAGRTVQAERAQLDGQVLSELDATAAASKLRARSPDDFQAFVKEAMGDGPVQDVYIRAEDLAQSGVDVAQLAQVSPAVAAQYEQALATGGDVRIPVDEYATRVAGTDLSQSMLPFLKTEPAGMTQAEAQEFMQNRSGLLRAEVEKVMAEREADAPFKESKDLVESELMTQLEQAARFTSDVNRAYAGMMSNFYAVQAARLGLTPQEMYQRYPVQIRAEGFGQLDQGMAAPAIGDVRQAWEDVGVDGFISEKGDTITVSKIVVPEARRGQGAGTRAMQQLVEYADATGKNIVLTPSPDFGGDVARLKAFYKQFGFVENKGRNRAFSTSEGMYREAPGKTLYQANQPNARGAYNIDTRTISLLQNADLSTFLHESGHFYLEVLTDIASQADAPAAVRDDVQKLMAWFGVPDLAAWNALDLEAKRPHHEQLARGFEAYLFEGKAPTPELQGLFQRFRAWMLAVYRSMTALNVELSDEVRGVFSRMLASTEQIRETETLLDYKPAFTSAEQAGMTAEEWAQYQALGLEATQDAVQQLEARSIRDMKWLSGARSRVIAQMQREAADKRKTVRKEVEAEVMAEPVNQAKTFMKRGIDPVTGDTVEGPTKLQISALEEMYGGEGNRYALLDWSQLGYGRYGMLAEDGLNPDIVADRFGFASGDGLVRSVLAAEDPRAKIEALTDQRMLERYGDLTDAQSIARAADEAVHNEARGRFIATEVNALQRALGQRQVLARAARQFAEATIARLRIRDVRPSQWAVAEARAARAAEQALRKNDLQGAAVEKKRQLVNNYATRAAQAAQAEIDKDLNYMKRLSNSTAQSGMRGESLVQLNALLARFDLRSSLSLRQIDAAKTQSLAEFIASESERLDAVMPDLPAYILDEGFRRHYKDMSVEEFRGLVDSVRQLANLARREQKMYTALRDMSFDEERSAVLARMREFNPKAFDEAGDPLAREPEFVPNIRKSVAKLGDGFAGEFLSAETILDILEGGKFGQVHESLFGRMSSRANWKATRMEKVYRDLKPLFKQWNLKERRDYGRKGIVVPSIGTSITRENALVAALLYGNADGRKRLENYGWNENRMQGVLDVLDERDWKLANAIWDQFDNKLWPELEALNKRTRGKAPPKVEALPFPTKFGEARGGYFRLKYDTDLDERAHRFDEGAAVKELLGGGMGMSAKTNQGTSTQRKDGVVMRPRLDLGVFVEAVNETVHDLALREAVADTMRLLNDKGVQTAIKSSVGVPAYRALVNRVREIAAPPRNPSGFIEKILASARRNTIVVLMSGVKTALQNVVGLVPALTRVNPGNIGLEMARFYSPAMAERYRFAMDNSEYMRHRYQNFDRDLNDMAAKLTVKGRLLPDTATMLALMGMVDRGVSVPVWNAAFKDGMAQFDNDNAKAADYADHIVRQTQGSGRDVDLPKIMSGHGGYGQLKRLFTMFYSYFNSQLQMLVRAGAIAKREASTNPGAAVGKFTLQFVMIAVLPAVLTEMMMGHGGDDEDEDKLAKRYARALAMYGAGMFPIVRDISSYTWSVFDTDTYNFGYKISPVQSAGEGVVKGIQSLADIVAGEGDIVDTKNAIMGTSFAFGLPGKLISDFVVGANAWMSGDAGPEALLFGAPRR
ncbi:GNAT family N-acetyltransferase [Achromobacter pestifer]|uniref:N-acetyltransferase domain-containing protein n=1 Tax=Achromobacter pestifer TaxID=1353889 RepID=A0A6S6YJZ2_9BURK|nr:GNAT family N-acetyltransferase [Achromobacter pestifer]CAB3624721.1 hypothetical protein LMG3431_00057 [Achromobacter pestifer]